MKGLDSIVVRVIQPGGVAPNFSIKVLRSSLCEMYKYETVTEYRTEQNTFLINHIQLITITQFQKCMENKVHYIYRDLQRETFNKSLDF